MKTQKTSYSEHPYVLIVSSGFYLVKKYFILCVVSSFCLVFFRCAWWRRTKIKIEQDNNKNSTEEIVEMNEEKNVFYEKKLLFRWVTYVFQVFFQKHFVYWFMIVQFHFEVRKRTKLEERKKNTEAKRNHKLHLVRLVSWLVYSIATLYSVHGAVHL